ncbi:hypothetical protein CKF59_07755, partial [Psittacicella gerlachiana]
EYGDYIPIDWSFLPINQFIKALKTGNKDANFSDVNGKYKFFTCSQNTLNCQSYSFDCDAILLSGNGELNVKHYSGKFDAYQRVYVIELNNRERYYKAPIYQATKSEINRFKMISSGSVIKFINRQNVESIRLFKFNNDKVLYSKLNTLLDQIELNNREIEKLLSLKQELIQLIFSNSIKVNL